MKQSVSADRYDEDWIKSAWGEGSTDDLLSNPDFLPRPRMARALELADIKPGQHILDIACGRGEAPALAYKRGAYAVGIDFSPSVLKMANALKEHALISAPEGSHLEFIQADATTLPFKDNMFDRVTMLDIVEHLTPEQLEIMFLEVRRVLKPDGYAVVHTLPNRWVYDITYPLLSIFSNRFPRNPRGAIEREIHINEQDLPRLHRMLEKTGFKHKIWLDQLMPAQARWQKDNDDYGDTRDKIYPLLTGVAGRFLELFSKTPLKLILCNDIYGLIWKDNNKPRDIQMPVALTERVTFFF